MRREARRYAEAVGRALPGHRLGQGEALAAKLRTEPEFGRPDRRAPGRRLRKHLQREGFGRED